MSEEKQLWVLAGGNGAGKSTFYHTWIAPLDLPFINADILAKELYPDTPEVHSYDAAKIAERMRFELLHQGRSFCFETVFSHPSKIDFVATAKTLGYEIVLVFIHLETVELNQARITQRVSEGGHSVPADKVKNRIPRLLKNIKAVMPLCDHVYILDNSRFDDPFQQLVSMRDQNITRQATVLPPWAESLLSDQSGQ